MTKYTYAQLEGLWIQAGGSSALAPTMAAIAEAESGGDSTAFNASGATGLWQILGAVNPADQPNLKDPATNAHEAVLKYQTQGLGAWVTYTTGAYKGFMNGATTPDTNVPAAGSGGGSSGGTGATPSDCIIGWSGLFGLGKFCLLSKSQARALIGGTCIAVGAGAVTVGFLILAAGAFQRTGGLGKAADVAAVIPGAQPLAAGLAVAQRRTTRTGAQAASRRAARRGQGQNGGDSAQRPQTPAVAAPQGA